MNSEATEANFGWALDGPERGLGQSGRYLLDSAQTTLFNPAYLFKQTFLPL